MRLPLAQCALVVAFIAISGCGGDADVVDSSVSERSTLDDVAATDNGDGGDGKNSADGGGSTEESVAFILAGETLDTSIITQCPATPGYALAFGAAGADRLQVGGGFQADQGRIYVRDSAGVEWNAGTDTALGALAFTLSDSGGNTNPFVTVKASGEVENETGDRLAFNVTVTCEPGGT